MHIVSRSNSEGAGGRKAGDSLTKKIQATISSKPLQPYSRDKIIGTSEMGVIRDFEIKFVEVQDGKTENRSSNAGGIRA